MILITVDTLRADRLGAYGYAPARTATIDGLARQGTMFRQAATPIPRTTPGFGSMLTGLWPHHHGSREVMEPLLHGRRIAEVLRDTGYRTIAVVSSPATDRPLNMDVGFDQWVGWGNGKNAEQVRASAVDEVRQAAGRPGPIFLWAAFTDPHSPYLPPDAWIPENVPNARWLGDALDGDRVSPGQMMCNRGGVAERALADVIRLYDAEVAYVDAELGRLLEELARLRGNRPRLIVFTADHGENFGEGGIYYHHGDDVSDAALRIPLIVAGPGIPVGRVDDTAVMIMDVAPTILAAVGVARPEWPTYDGVPLFAQDRPAGNDPSSPRQFAESAGSSMMELSCVLESNDGGWIDCIHGPRFSYCKHSVDGTEFLYDHQADPRFKHELAARNPAAVRELRAAREHWPIRSARQRTVRTPRFKLVETPVLAGGFQRSLFDLTSPDGERRDVSAEHPDVAQQLGAALERFFQDVPPYGPQDRTDSQLENLRALGYVH